MNKPFLCDAPSEKTLFSSTNLNAQNCHIVRRNIDTGWINTGSIAPKNIPSSAKADWKNNKPIFLPAFFNEAIKSHTTEIESSERLYHSMLEGKAIDELLDQPEYLTRLGERFELLSTRFDESDRQELVSVDFDAMENGELAMEDIWMRVSWLSFLETEESLRFRFSFGMEGFDDVSLDLDRQLAAADLCERLFPESGLISKSEPLKQLLKDLTSLEDLYYLERIVYYNAKNGGAQFHHDAEKGHLGVVYAQLTGQTLWLALSKEALIKEIQIFLSDVDQLAGVKSVVSCDEGYEQIVKAGKDKEVLECLLDDPTNDEISEFLNGSSAFFAHIMAQDYSYVLRPGDVMLLPQESMANCAWHSVFCLGEKAGQALSFAIKPA